MMKNREDKITYTMRKQIDKSKWLSTGVICAFR